MTLDGGWGYILSTVIGVVLAEVFNFWRRASDQKHKSVDDAAENAQTAADAASKKADELEKQFLRYQAHVAENYYPKGEQRDFERAIFAKLDDIVKLINTKADKE
jgi:hypothetical protein